MCKNDSYRIADWPTSPWVRLAHETWTAYDSEADAREVRSPYGNPSAPPKMSPVGLPQIARGGFEQLFQYRCMSTYDAARDAGFTGTHAEWRQEVKKHGR